MTNIADNIIDITIGTFIFTALIGTIATAVIGATNVSGAALTLLGLTTLLVVVGFIRSIMKVSGAKR